MPGIVPSALQILTPLVFILVLRLRSYYPPFTDQKVRPGGQVTYCGPASGAWLQAAPCRQRATRGVLRSVLPLFKVFLKCKASPGDCCSLVTSTVKLQESSTGSADTSSCLCQLGTHHSQTRQLPRVWDRCPGKILGRVSTGELNPCGFAHTAASMQRLLWWPGWHGGGQGW